MTSQVVSANMVSPVDSGPTFTLELVSISSRTDDLPVVTAKPLKTNKEGHEVVEIIDPEFVPEGFHESCEEDGGIKVTEENASLLINTDRLVKMHTESGWATEKDKTYTPDMTGFTPSEEEILNLQMKGYVLRGRIVCSSGSVFNADSKNDLMSITQDDVEVSVGDFDGALSWFYSNQREHISPPHKFKINDVTLSGEGVGFPSQSEKKCFPHGDYLLKDKTIKKNSLGLTVFTMCDNPSCLKMSSIILEVCMMGGVPKEYKDCAMEYLKERNIYHINDQVNGNTDICQMCIGKIGIS
jgi:hypothetical protein